MSKHHILILHYNSLPLLHGAALKCVTTLAKAGYKVTLVKLAPRTDSGQEEDQRIYQQVPSDVTIRQLKLITRRLPRFAMQSLKFIEMLFRFIGVVLRTPCDCVMGFDPPAVLPAYLGARVSGKPVLHFALELYPEQHWVRGKTIWRIISRFLGPRVNGLVVVDEKRAEYMVGHYRARNPVVINNTPSFRLVERTTVLQDTAKSQGSSATKIGLYQGQIEAPRGVEQLIEAGVYLDEGVAIAIIGKAEPDYEMFLRQKIRDLGLEHKIFLLKPVPPAEVWQYTASAHCGLIVHLPISLNFQLNVGATNKLYEYFMAGIPVLAPNYPGYPELIEGEQVGKCVDPHDPRAIAQAIHAIVADDEQWENMRRRALQLAKDRFNWEIDGGKFLRTVHELVQKKTKPSD